MAQPPRLQRAVTGGDYANAAVPAQISLSNMAGPPHLQRAETEGGPRSQNSLSAAAAAGRAIPADSDISKEKMKTRLSFFARPKPPSRHHSFGNPLDDSSNRRTSNASDLGLGGGSFNSNCGSRRRSAFEEAAANLQQQQKQQQQQEQDHTTDDEQIKSECKRPSLHDGGTKSQREMHKYSDRSQEDEKHRAALPNGQEEDVPQIRNWLRDMGGNDEPVSLVPPPPQLEYDTSGRAIKSEANTLAAVGANAPGAYSAGPGMEQLLDAPDNYGRLGVIGRGSVKSSTKSKKEDDSKEFRKSGASHGAYSGKHNEGNSPKDLKSLEEGGPVILEGTLEDDPKNLVWWKKKPAILAILLVAVVAIVVSVVLVLQSNSSSESETSEQQKQQQTDNEATIEEEWVPLVPDMTNSTIVALEDSFSQQSQAYAWIAEDPDWDTYENWRKQQRFAMMCLFFAFRGSRLDYRFNPTHFSHECEWLSFFGSCGENDRGEINKIGMIQFLDITFQGTMPPEIAFLSNLEEIEFRGDFKLTTLEDMFPLDAINSLPPIKSLTFNECQLAGSIPSTLGLLTSMTSLDLPGTSLVSTIPSQLGLLSDLTTLTLSSNGITGSIPEAIGDLPSLINLDVSNNPDLELPIPSGFCSDDRIPFESLVTDWCVSPDECCGT